MKTCVWNLLDLVENFGDEYVSEIVDDFSTKRKNEEIEVILNADIEIFLKNNSIQFAKEKKSVTYLVTD